MQKFTDITEKMIQDWKSNPDIMGLTQVDIQVDENLISGKKAQFIICQPTRQVLSAVAKYGADKKFEKSNEVLIKSCVLGGDMEYLLDSEDQRVELKLLEEIGRLLELKQVAVKKL